MSPKRMAATLVGLLRRRRLDEDLDAEILAHLELAERDGLAAGLSPKEARRRALVQFGGMVRVKEEHRDRRSARWIETFLRDFHHGMQGLFRDPGFSALIISVLALGIGANVAMFSLVDAVLLKPLPFQHPERIVRVWEAPRPGGVNSTSTLDYRDWKRLATEFEALSAERSISAALTGSGEPRRLSGKVVTSNYFRVFTANVALGRTFLEEEDQRGAEPVIVLSHAAWLNHFGGDPDVLRKRPILDGEPHQVVGVLQPSAFDRDRAEYWKPLIFTPEEETRGQHWLQVHGRLRPGATIEQARERMQMIDAALAEVTPAFKQDWTIVVEPFESLLVGENLRQSISVAFGAVALVLLIACANVANLLLAKGASRRKELAVRAALGAGRGRLVAQLLTESLALCLAGGASGLGVAALLIRLSAPAFGQMIPFTADVGLDFRALAFAAAIALGVALLVGSLPALQTDFAKLSRTLNRTSRGASGGHVGLRRALVVGEVAMSLVLVCGAALLLRSLFNLQQLDTGVRIENIITVSVDLPLPDYPTAERAAQFYQAVIEGIEAAPGVERAAAASHLPLRWIGNGEGLKVPGLEELINTRFKRVDPGYFETLGIPLLSGRGIESTDRVGGPGVVVINEAMADRLADVAGVTEPIGRTVEITSPGYTAGGDGFKPYVIVGVIRSERVNSPGSPDPPVSYFAMAQSPLAGLKLIALTESNPMSVIPAIRAAIREIDPNLPIGDIATMEQVRDGSLSGATRPAWVIGSFAAVAALLAAVGLYGVLAQSVTMQRRDIGIQMALGASSGAVMTKVLRGAMTMILVGLALGLAGALAATRLLQSLLFNTSALDPLALAAACATMAALGLLAALIPARRAAGVDPMTVLRDEG